MWLMLSTCCPDLHGRPQYRANAGELVNYHYALPCSHSYEYFDRLSFDNLFFGKRNAKALYPNIAIDCLALVV